MPSRTPLSRQLGMHFVIARRGATDLHRAALLTEREDLER